ncbi:MAG TPA: CAP domain-containing protein [Candidatus Polarisedimenticolaceae bacterium]|nr:CAP domain-containing protein [Candidatus Polarisedimenticolaceae bacterium]
MSCSGRLVVLAVLAAIAGGGAVTGAPDDDVAAAVVDRLQIERRERGAPPLERRPGLDRVALERAREIAALPHSGRLSHAQPVGDQLRAAGIRWFSRAAAHVDMVRGYLRPETGFLRSWRDHDTAWTNALASDFTTVGAATARSADGWIVLVIVLVVDLPYPEDTGRLEQAVIELVNRVRDEHGLGRLAGRADLAVVARRHSEEMARRDFVAHVDPDGHGTADRVLRAGLRFLQLGENIHMNRGARDPAAFAVERWLGSPGHRETMLDPAFVETGVGAAIADDGRIFITQVFIAPAPTR